MDLTGYGRFVWLCFDFTLCLILLVLVSAYFFVPFYCCFDNIDSDDDCDKASSKGRF